MNTNHSPDLSLYLPSLTPGGAPRIMINVAEYLHGQGYGVEFVLAKKEGDFLSHVDDDIDIVGLDSRVIRSVPSLRRYITRKEPSVLLSTTHAANLAAIWATALARTDTTHVVREPTTLSNQAAEFTSFKDRVIPFLVKRSYPHAGQFIAISQGVKRELVEYIGVSEGKIDVIYNPIITPDIQPKSNEPVSHPWFEEQTPVVLGVGRLTDQKDFSTLVRAFARVRNERPCRLLILGEGSKRAQLEALVSELDIDDHVDLPGYVDNPYKYMSRADVFVLSSAWEGFGNVVVESMECGTPVVATNCESGPSEILEDGRYGDLVPVGDSEAMADAILATLEDPLEADVLRDRAAEFSIEKILPQYESLLFDS